MGLKNIELPQVANALMNAIHEEEMDIINELYDACLREDGEKVEPLLEFLLAHAEDHFLTEEELMREAEFFAYLMHKAEHDSMRKELKLLWEKWKREKSPIDISSFIENRLVPWLLLHIARWDSTTALHLGD
jgi:hemerythrin